ncbi:MAG: SDR family oxidoreductase [Rhodospirillaceae bacterium]|jgi:NAD(P)-dependent dehydrogenase (short-subunit alcohol dehydrogenase family)|nr:SDR family oxidoreductase [Rhodospirillaceae bacterium]MBT4940746.1 SDR family oxidoreductase [Rhodospirillaceae bacterium]MBT5939973.1 SDR family oxidoreductase [Rhodospirillaceae bacterium]MBT7267130.1 SDR family oxidoreductase [Rhodospirillaceae bacterium]
MTDPVDVKALTSAPNFDGQIALVTGGGKGLGRACVLALAAAGAKVIAVARTESDLQEVQAHNPDKIDYWVEDVLADNLYSKIEAMDQLDVLVGCAGGNKPEPVSDITVETLDWMLDLNVRAIFRASQSAAKVMLSQGSGSIINMSSQMGHVGAPNRTLYCTTKHAVEGLTKALGVELAPNGIRVNAVAPTFIDTPMTRPMFENPEFKKTVVNNIALGHVGTIEDVAAAVLFLASPAAAMITGESLKVDGGWTAW